MKSKEVISKKSRVFQSNGWSRPSGGETKKKDTPKRVLLFGDPAGTRTPDLRLKRALLYQLSYWVSFICARRMAGRGREAWLGWLDSNQRMRESKSRALPLGYTPISENQKRRAGADAPALSP